MTLRPGDRIIARNLPRKPKGSEETLPPTIAMVVSASADGLMIRLRVGGTGAQLYAPKPRRCPVEAAVRMATDRECFHGLVIDPI